MNSEIIIAPFEPLEGSFLFEDDYDSVLNSNDVSGPSTETYSHDDTLPSASASNLMPPLAYSTPLKKKPREKRLKCSECAFETNRSFNFKRHMRCHTRDFLKCDISNCWVKSILLDVSPQFFWGCVDSVMNGRQLCYDVHI